MRVRGFAAFALCSVAGPATAQDWARHIVVEGFNCQTAVAADFTGDGLADVIADASGETRLYVAPGWKEIVLHRGRRRG